MLASAVRIPKAVTSRCRTHLLLASRRHLTLPGHKAENVSTPLISRLGSAGVYLVLGVGAAAYYREWKKLKRRLEPVEEEFIQDRYIKADLPLVRYRGTVIPKSMVTTGVMEDIKSFEVRDDDVLVCSFPKAGTTWLQEVVYRLCHLRGEKDAYPNDVMETKFPYLEFAYPGLRDVAARKGRRFLKTHLPRHLLPDSLSSSKAKVLYIYRNPKDVAVSYYYFCRMLVYIDYVGTLAKFLRSLFYADRAPYSPFFPHLLGYDQFSKSDPGRCLCVRYEDMQEDPKREIQKVAKFLGLDDLTEEEVASVASATSFEAMRSNPLTNYSHWDDWGLRAGKKGKATDFYRKGIVGDYENQDLDKYVKEEFDAWIETGSKALEGMELKFSVSNKEKNKSPSDRSEAG